MKPDQIRSMLLSFLQFSQLRFLNVFCLFLVGWIFIAACRLSLVEASGGCSLVAVCRLLIVVASLLTEHRL